jgi:DNA polymerase elongation subunit (family B)
MRAVYLQTWSKENTAGEEPAWVNPFTAQIFGVYWVGDLNPEPTALVIGGGPTAPFESTRVVGCSNERELLVEFWKHYKGTPPETIATYNGRKHAVPCLYWRSAVHQVEIANPDFLHDRYKAGPHVDLAEVLAYHGLLRIPALSVVAQNFGLGLPTLPEGETVQQMIRAHLATANEALLRLLVKSGLEHAQLIAQVAAHWRKHLQATAYR